MPLNVEEVASEVLNRKVDRVDIAVLEALERAPRKTMRWENRMESTTLPPLPGAPKGTPPRQKHEIIPGLESAVNAWCDSRPDLTIQDQPPIVERHKQTGELLTHEREPIVRRCTIARLEALVSGTNSCPGLVEHLGGADEQTAAKPTRLLQLSDTGEAMLALWRDGKVKGVPYPDPKPPAAAEPEKQYEPERETHPSGSANDPA